MAYADSANYNKIKSTKGFPIGSIIPWSGAQDSIPIGWVLCNGAVISITRYPLLHECIGNSYGGTSGSTFRLPPLTNGKKAIADFFTGYYNYLRSGTTADSFPYNAHTPTNPLQSTHPLWKNVGLGFNGDESGNVQTSHISTIDIEGEFANTPNNFVAQFLPITLSEGQESVTVSYNSRKLGDGHMPSHAHGLEYTNGENGNSWERLGRLTLQHLENFRCGASRGFPASIFCGSGPACVCQTSRTTAARAVRYLRFGNDQNHLREDFVTNTNPGGTTVTTGPAGGGGTIAPGTPASVQERVVLYRAGDGYGRGDMLSSGNVFFSSLSNSEVSFSQLTGHNHGINTYNFLGRLSVISPGLVANVSLNTVRIDNSSGRNFGIITVNSSTANLTMLYIIKAY
jgi:hypothetical protein